MNTDSSLFAYYLAGLLVIALVVALKVAFGTRRKDPRTPAPSLASEQRGLEARASEQMRLHFAAAVLSGLGLIFAVAMGMYHFGESAGDAPKEIFDACKTIIPPIVTLILGYYFGKSAEPDR